MYSLRSLSALALAVPVHAAWRARRPEQRDLPNNMPFVLKPHIDVATVSESAGKPTRVMQWILIGEFLSALEKRSDLIVIDLRANALWNPFLISNAFTLPVTSKELDTVLEWLPADRSVVFYGASNLSIFMIETSHCMEGSAPLYILEADLGIVEVA
jgi:hypothetical protein